MQLKACLDREEAGNLSERPLWYWSPGASDIFPAVFDRLANAVRQGQNFDSGFPATARMEPSRQRSLPRTRSCRFRIHSASWHSLTNLFKQPRYIADTLQQADVIGVGSLPIVILTGFSWGGAGVAEREFFDPVRRIVIYRAARIAFHGARTWTGAHRFDGGGPQRQWNGQRTGLNESHEQIEPCARWAPIPAKVGYTPVLSTMVMLFFSPSSLTWSA